ncbi:hypothetical protein FORC13_p223 (plasmid) [Bacillus cereus]|uniref:hypothetical protein n=1 Tax=Bacillus cereus TaxID=1396 RepID=UPI000744B4CB|nr:hypothetical protein [Bacillus cereus]ALZ64708.1 hypothetical protein FORC13_p223 [Bacillus cereus]
MDKIKFGGLDIYFPKATISRFWISQDFVDFFKVDTNDEALQKIRKYLRENMELKLYKHIEFDCESDAVTISISKAEVMFLVAEMINDLLNIKVLTSEKEKIKKEMHLYKKPKKQKWNVGDIFSIPLQNNMCAFGQILEKIGNYEAFCVLFDGMYEEEASVNEAVCSKNIKVVLTIESYELDKHLYPVVEHRVPVILFPDNEKYDELRYPSHYSSILRDLAEAFQNIRNWKHYYDEALEYQYLVSEYYSESSNG